MTVRSWQPFLWIPGEGTYQTAELPKVKAKDSESSECSLVFRWAHVCSGDNGESLRASPPVHKLQSIFRLYTRTTTHHVLHPSAQLSESKTSVECPQPIDLPQYFPLSRLFRVIGTDTDRLATYDFLHSNQYHGPVSHYFRDKRLFRSKIAKFFHLRVFNTHGERFL